METSDSIGVNVAIVTTIGSTIPEVGDSSKPFSNIMSAIDSGARNLLIYPGTYDGAKIYGDVNLTGIGEVTVRYINVEVGKVILDNLTINYLEDSGDVTVTNCNFIGSPSIVAYGTLNLFDCRLRSTNNAIAASSHSILNISGCQFTSTNTNTFVSTLPGGGYGSWQFSHCTFNIVDPHPIDPEVISARQSVNLNYFDSIINTTSTTNTLSQVLSIVNTDVQDYAANIHINNVSLNGAKYYRTLKLELAILEQYVRQSNNVSYDSTVDPKRGSSVDVNGHIYAHAMTSHNGLTVSNILPLNSSLTIGDFSDSKATIFIQNDTTILSPLSVNVIEPSASMLTVTKPIEVSGISIGKEQGLIGLTGTNTLQLGEAGNSIVIPGTLTVTGHRVEATLIGPDTAIVTLNGSDTTGRVGNVEFPFSTIEGALRVASNIILAPGTYHQSVTISSNASMSSWDAQNTDIKDVTVNNATVTFNGVIINTLNTTGTISALDCTIGTVSGTGSLTLKRCTTGTITYNGTVDIFTSNTGNINGSGSWTIDGCSISVTGSGNVVVMDNSNGSISLTNSSILVSSVTNPGTLTIVSATTNAILANVNLVGGTIFSSVNTGVTSSDSHDRLASGVVMDSKPVYSYGLIMDKDRLYTDNITATGNEGIGGILTTNTVKASTGSTVTVDGTLDVITVLDTNTINPLSGSTTITLGTSSDTIDVPGTLNAGTLSVSGSETITGDLTVDGTLDTNTINPLSGSKITLGTSSDTIDVPGTLDVITVLDTNTIKPLSGSKITLGASTDTIDVPGTLDTNTINPSSGSKITLGTSSDTIDVPGTETIGTTDTNTGSLTIHGSSATTALTVDGSTSITDTLDIGTSSTAGTLVINNGGTSGAGSLTVHGSIISDSLTVDGKTITPTMFDNTAALVSSGAVGSGQLGNWDDPYPSIGDAVTAGAVIILILPGSYGSYTSTNSASLSLIGLSDPRTHDVVVDNLTWTDGPLNLSNLNISGTLTVNNGTVVANRCNIASVSFHGGSVEFNDCILGPISDYSTSGYISASRSSISLATATITISSGTITSYNSAVISNMSSTSTTIWRFSHCTIFVPPSSSAPTSSFELFEARYGVSVYLTSCSFEYLGHTPTSSITVTIVDTTSSSPAGNVSIIDFVATGSGYTIASGVVHSSSYVRTVDNLSTSATLSYDIGFQVDNAGNLYTASETITGDLTVDGTLDTNTINPSSGSTITLGTSSDTIDVPGTLDTNTINPSSGSTITLGTSSDTIDVPGTLNAGTLSVSGSETITGDLTVDGTLNAGTLSVSGSETITGDLTVDGSANVSNNLTVGSTMIADKVQISSYSGGTSTTSATQYILQNSSTNTVIQTTIPANSIFSPVYGYFNNSSEQKFTSNNQLISFSDQTSSSTISINTAGTLITIDTGGIYQVFFSIADVSSVATVQPVSSIGNAYGFYTYYIYPDQYNTGSFITSFTSSNTLGLEITFDTSPSSSSPAYIGRTFAGTGTNTLSVIITLQRIA